MIAAYTASKHGVLGLVRIGVARGGAHGGDRQRRVPGLRRHPDDRRVGREHLGSAPGSRSSEAREILARRQPNGRLVTVERGGGRRSCCASRTARSTARASTSTAERSSHERPATGVNPASLAEAVGLQPRGRRHAVRRSSWPARPRWTPTGSSWATGSSSSSSRRSPTCCTALAEAGGAPTDLASLTVFIVDMDDYRSHAREIGEVWRRLVGTDVPRDGRHRRVPALGRRGAGRGAGVPPSSRRSRGPGPSGPGEPPLKAMAGCVRAGVGQRRCVPSGPARSSHHGQEVRTGAHRGGRRARCGRGTAHGPQCCAGQRATADLDGASGVAELQHGPPGHAVPARRRDHRRRRHGPLAGQIGRDPHGDVPGRRWTPGHAARVRPDRT